MSHVKASLIIELVDLLLDYLILILCGVNGIF